MIRTKTKPFYESKLYIGSMINGLTAFDQMDLEKYIRSFQSEYEEIIPIRITPTTFISGKDYREGGFEVSAINYPKIDTNSIDIEIFMKKLAEALIERFTQNTICVVDSSQIIMYENNEQNQRTTQRT